MKTCIQITDFGTAKYCPQRVNKVCVSFPADPPLCAPDQNPLRSQCSTLCSSLVTVVCSTFVIVRRCRRVQQGSPCLRAALAEGLVATVWSSRGREEAPQHPWLVLLALSGARSPGAFCTLSQGLGCLPWLTFPSRLPGRCCGVSFCSLSHAGVWAQWDQLPVPPFGTVGSLGRETLSGCPLSACLLCANAGAVAPTPIAGFCGSQSEWGLAFLLVQRTFIIADPPNHCPSSSVFPSWIMCRDGC